MCMGYECENKQITTALTVNNYVNVMAMNSKANMIIKKFNGKFVVERTKEVDEQ